MDDVKKLDNELCLVGYSKDLLRRHCVACARIADGETWEMPRDYHVNRIADNFRKRQEEIHDV